jgi:hypothetical protein
LTKHAACCLSGNDDCALFFANFYENTSILKENQSLEKMSQFHRSSICNKKYTQKIGEGVMSFLFSSSHKSSLLTHSLTHFIPSFRHTHSFLFCLNEKEEVSRKMKLPPTLSPLARRLGFLSNFNELSAEN